MKNYTLKLIKRRRKVGGWNTWQLTDEKGKAVDTGVYHSVRGTAFQKAKASKGTLTIIRQDGTLFAKMDFTGKVVFKDMEE